MNVAEDVWPLERSSRQLYLLSLPLFVPCPCLSGRMDWVLVDMLTSGMIEPAWKADPKAIG